MNRSSIYKSVLALSLTFITGGFHSIQAAAPAATEADAKESKEMAEPKAGTEAGAVRLMELPDAPFRKILSKTLQSSLRYHQGFQITLEDPSGDLQMIFENAKKDLGIKKQIFLFCESSSWKVTKGFNASGAIGKRKVMAILIGKPRSDMSDLDKLLIYHELAHAIHAKSLSFNQLSANVLCYGGIIGLSCGIGAIVRKSKISRSVGLSTILAGGIALYIGTGILSRVARKLNELQCDKTAIDLGIKKKEYLSIVKRANVYFNRHKSGHLTKWKQALDTHPSHFFRATYHARKLYAAGYDSLNSSGPDHIEFNENLKKYYPKLYERAQYRHTESINPQAKSKRRYLVPALAIGAVAAGITAYCLLGRKTKA